MKYLRDLSKPNEMIFVKGYSLNKCRFIQHTHLDVLDYISRTLIKDEHNDVEYFDTIDKTYRAHWYHSTDTFFCVRINNEFILTNNASRIGKRKEDIIELLKK